MNPYNYAPNQPLTHDQYQGTSAPNLYPSASNSNDPYSLHRRSYEHETGLAQNAFAYNQSAIPGLGLGAGTQDGGFPGRSNIGNVVIPAPPTAGYPDTYAGNRIANVFPADATTPSGDDVQAVNAELSDGELEDIYEPLVDGSLPPLQSRTTRVPGDRLHSYSPELSPIDVEPPYDIAHVNGAVSSLARGAVVNNNNGEQTTAAPQESWDYDRLEKARGDAREAILRLWPLQVRYENYIENGIDKSLLQSLFKELGLNTDTPTANGPSAARVKPLPTPRPAAHAQAGPSGAAASGDDTLESRKDRIARLLAAKGSRQPTASAATSPTMTPETKPQPPPGKSIDKSKLLYEKMEALRKAREAKAEVANRGQQPQAVSHSTGDPPPPPDKHQPVAVVNEAGQGYQASASPEVRIGQTGPGLPSTRSPPLAPRSMLQKRPIASDFLSQTQEPAPKRPFSQTDRSRRFLIDVSEDEDSDDDTAMDLDSPEQRPLTLRRNATGDSALRNLPPLSDLPSNGRSTPNSGMGRSNNSHGKENLDKMQQDIEEMKKRIAEAEARKKVKQSRQGTPYQSPSNGRSETGAASPASGVIADSTLQSGLASASRILSQASDDATLPQSDNASVPGSASMPRLIRSLSRAALDRLAVIEADRKRQTLKMKILRAQLTQMEKELAAGLEEEKALREESTPSPAPEQAEAFSLPEQGRSPGVAVPEQQPVEAQLSTESPRMSASMGASDPGPDVTDLSATDHSTQEPTKAPRGTFPDAKPMTADDIRSETSLARDHVDMEDAAPQSAPAELVEPTGDAVARGTPPPDSTGPPFEVEELHGRGSTPESVEMERSSSEPDNESSQGTDVSCEPSTESLVASSSVAHQSPSVSVAPPLHEDQAIDMREGSPASSGSDSPKSTTSEHRAKSSSVERASQEETTADDCPPPAVSSSSAANEHTFRPYESPLQYFHAYRFHPEYNSSVKGGLRSLTYSNKLDVRQQLCPEELLGQQCPRGEDCDFQHLGKVAAPDDQILMQLGSYGAYEGPGQEKFNQGLRELLAKLHEQKVKDFPTLSQAIIDYRTQFHNDRSRILPLGNVSL